MHQKPSFKDYVIASRPWSFPASFAPAFVSFLYIISVYDTTMTQVWHGILAIFGALALHAGGNLINDYQDYGSSVDQEGIIGSGSLTSGKFTPRQIYLYGATCLGASTVAGIYLAFQAGPGILVLAAFGIASASLYHVFKYRALGDFLILFAFGPGLMVGCGYAMLGHIEWRLVLLSLPIACITVGILHANNTRDRASDQQAGILTLPILVGAKVSIWLYGVLIALAYITLGIMLAINMLPPIAALPLLTAPLAIKNYAVMRQSIDKTVAPINHLDQSTAQLQIAFSGLLSLALVIESLWS